jgi:hypothetical protein
MMNYASFFSFLKPIRGQEALVKLPRAFSDPFSYTPGMMQSTHYEPNSTQCSLAMSVSHFCYYFYSWKHGIGVKFRN